MTELRCGDKFVSVVLFALFSVIPVSCWGYIGKAWSWSDQWTTLVAKLKGDNKANREERIYTWSKYWPSIWWKSV